MSKTTHVTRLGRIQIALSEALIKSLKGEPLLNSEGNPIFIDGKAILGPPKAGILKEAREYLKDMGITEEPEEASGAVVEVAKRIQEFEKDEDALLLTATKEA